MYGSWTEDVVLWRTFLLEIIDLQMTATIYFKDLRRPSSIFSVYLCFFLQNPAVLEIKLIKYLIGR